MQLSLEHIENLSSEVWFFRFWKMKDDQYLITNDAWLYSILSEVEFTDFITGKLEGKKRSELLEKHFYKNTIGYEKAVSDLYNQRNRFLAFGPALHMIVTTLRCNHKCQYCHAAVAPMTAKNLDMTIETAKKVVDTIFYTSNPNITIEFQWGESLVNWEVVQFIIEYAEQKSAHLKKNLNFALVTNLSLMDEAKLLYLMIHRVSICTSLDGDKETHNWQRTFAEWDSYDKVTYWIKRIREAYAERWWTWGAPALLTLTRPALQNYKKVIDAYVDLGLDMVWLRWLNPYGFAAAEKERLSYSPEEFIEFFHKAMDYIIELNLQGTFVREMISQVYLTKIIKGIDPNFMDIRSPSGPAIWCVAYNYNGDVYASDESRMLGRMGMYDFLMTPMLDTWEATYRAMAESDVTKIAVQTSTLDGLPGYNDHVYKPYMWVDMIYAYTQDGNPYSSFMKDARNKMQLARIDYLFEKMEDPKVKQIFESWIL
jgi:uncharacterized protein